MSLQKRFKARYPKANFSDFKTEDFFGKPNIFFHSEAGEGTAVFDDGRKRFQTEYLFLKRDEEATWSRTGFPSWINSQS